MAHLVTLQTPIPRESMATLFVVSWSGCFVQCFDILRPPYLSPKNLRKCCQHLLKESASNIITGITVTTADRKHAVNPWAAPAIRDVRDSVGLTTPGFSHEGTQTRLNLSCTKVCYTLQTSMENPRFLNFTAKINLHRRFPIAKWHRRVLKKCLEWTCLLLKA